MAENEGRLISGIEAVLQLPDVIVGGKPADNKFQVFSKETLLAAIASAVAQRKNSIRITGVTGSMIVHPDLVGRRIASMIIDDILRNTNFEKGNADDINSDEVILTDEFKCKPPMWITINLE